MFRRPRLYVLVLAHLLLGCSWTADDRAADDRAADEVASLEDVQDGLRLVADEREEADAAVAEALDAVRQVDEVVRLSRSRGRVVEGLAGVDEARERLETVDVEDARERLAEMASATARTRASAAEALTTADGWEAEYLEAQDVVLRRLREYAAAGDALVQVVDRHRGIHLDVLGALATVRDDRRDEQDTDDDPGEGWAPEPELLETVESALARHLESLEMARGELADYREEFQERAESVNRATADAATVFDQRPGP